jgi:hypothetical protein
MMNVLMRKLTQQMLKKLLLIKLPVAAEKKLGNRMMAGLHPRMRQKQ